jgi:pimeloyl-ACP methyl ester carboxylesterase
MEITDKIEDLPGSGTPAGPESRIPYPPVLRFIRAGFSLAGPLAPRLAARFAYRLFTTPRIRARHAVSDEWLETARRFPFEFQSMRLQAYEWGRGRRTVLLAHGWESRGTALRHFVPPLLDLGYRVLAIDGPAHGESEGKHTHMRQYAEVLAALIRSEGTVDGVIGHSFGGAATLYALGHLDPGLKLEKVALVAVPGSLIPFLEEVTQTLSLPPAVALELRHIMEGIGGRPLEELDAVKGRAHRRIGAILLVHDEEDTAVPVSSSYEMLRSWDNARMLRTRGLGHSRLMKDPRVVERVGAFFKEK